MLLLPCLCVYVWAQIWVCLYFVSDLGRIVFRVAPASSGYFWHDLSLTAFSQQFGRCECPQALALRSCPSPFKLLYHSCWTTQPLLSQNVSFVPSLDVITLPLLIVLVCRSTSSTDRCTCNPWTVPWSMFPPRPGRTKHCSSSMKLAWVYEAQGESDSLEN